MPRLKVNRVSETWHRISIDTGMVKVGHYIYTELVYDSVLNEKVNASRLSHQLIGVLCCNRASRSSHDDVIKWKHFPRNWPFVWGIHRSPVNSPHKGQWRRALMFTLICARINGWVNNRYAGDLRRYRPHNDVIVMHSSGSKEMARSLAAMHNCTGPAFRWCGVINPYAFEFRTICLLNDTFRFDTVLWSTGCKKKNEQKQYRWKYYARFSLVLCSHQG